MAQGDLALCGMWCHTAQDHSAATYAALFLCSPAIQLPSPPRVVPGSEWCSRSNLNHRAMRFLFSVFGNEALSSQCFLDTN